MNKIDKINEWIWNVGILKELFDDGTLKKNENFNMKNGIKKMARGRKWKK